MAGKGQVYKRRDGKYAFRVLAANGQIVATDGGQGYDHERDAEATLQKLMSGGFNGPVAHIEENGSDSKVEPTPGRR